MIRFFVDKLTAKPARFTIFTLRAKRWLFVALLIAVALALGGCGVPYEGVDVEKTAPTTTWQSLVVWPLAKALIYLDRLIQAAGIPYHWGFAIIVFTILVKVVTLPLTISQIRGMQAQKNIQPKIQELQKKYGKDREKMAQEQMKLYQEAGVNPLSGCLPLLIQMPILIGLYAALVAIGPLLKNTRWFWIPDLGFPNYNLGLGWLADYFNNGSYGLLAAYLILPVLLIITQVWMQKSMTPPTNDPQAQSMQQVSMVMTLMFGFFTLQVPAGLTLYWVTSNLLQMLQQWLFTHVGLTPSVAKVSDKVTVAESAKTTTVDSKATVVPKQTTSSNKPAAKEKTGSAGKSKQK